LIANNWTVVGPFGGLDNEALPISSFNQTNFPNSWMFEGFPADLEQIV